MKYLISKVMWPHHPFMGLSLRWCLVVGVACMLYMVAPHLVLRRNPQHESSQGKVRSVLPIRGGSRGADVRRYRHFRRPWETPAILAHCAYIVEHMVRHITLHLHKLCLITAHFTSRRINVLTYLLNTQETIGLLFPIFLHNGSDIKFRITKQYCI